MVERSEKKPTLRLSTKLGYASGDHTLNLTLSALTLIYLHFLMNEIGLRAELVGLIFSIGRLVDAFTDPVMGRISDLTRWKLGRRRPYFLLGAIPFGLSFALLWSHFPVQGQMQTFSIYCTLYILFSASSTVLAVPYIALLPELTSDYHERTVLSTYRSGGAVLGALLAAAAFLPLANAFGGSLNGYRAAGWTVGLWITIPWFIVFFTTKERSDPAPPSAASFTTGLKAIVQHRSYRLLVGLYLFARMATDIVAGIFLIYFTYWLARPEDFELTLGVLLVASVLSLPLWLQISRVLGKRELFLAGISWWMMILALFFFATPEWPRWALFALAIACGPGFAAADVMPWSMLGDVIDEDEFQSGERREGIYAGSFTFIRKLGGAGAALLIGFSLGFSGFIEGGSEQPLVARQMIRSLTTIAPILLLLVAVLIATAYPLSRKVHQEILSQLNRN